MFGGRALEAQRGDSKVGAYAILAKDQPIPCTEDFA